MSRLIKNEMDPVSVEMRARDLEEYEGSWRRQLGICYR